MHKNPANQTKKVGINGLNAGFLILSPAIAVLGFVWIQNHGGFHPATWIWFGFWLTATGLGITAGYHRLFSHRTFEASPLARVLLLAFGAAGFQHSALKWSADHRRHHEFVDRDQDPYSIKKGFWYAHILWVFFHDPEDERMAGVPDLRKDKFVMFQHRYYMPLAIFMSFLLPTAGAALWGDALGGFVLAGWVRIVLNHHFTFFVNSLAHFMGRQPYSLNDSSKDNPLVAFLTYGEGYHNFHHTFQGDYRNGIRPWQWDPTKWLIQGLAHMGWAWNLRVTPELKILKARLKVDELRIQSRIPELSPPLVQSLQTLRGRIEASAQRWHELKAEYRAAKRDSEARARKRLAELKAEINLAKRAFRQDLTLWRQMLKGALPARL